MRKFFLIIGFISFSINNIKAQTIDTAVRYPILIKFESICCGVPSDKPIKLFINKFKKSNHIKKITANRIGPMGREGEYYLAFRLNKLNKKQKSNFIKGIKAAVLKLTDKGKAEYEENVVLNTDSFPSIAVQTIVIF